MTSTTEQWGAVRMPQYAAGVAISKFAQKTDRKQVGGK